MAREVQELTGLLRSVSVPHPRPSSPGFRSQLCRIGEQTRCTLLWATSPRIEPSASRDRIFRAERSRAANGISTRVAFGALECALQRMSQAPEKRSVWMRQRPRLDHISAMRRTRSVRGFLRRCYVPYHETFELGLCWVRTRERLRNTPSD